MSTRPVASKGRKPRRRKRAAKKRTPYQEAMVQALGKQTIALVELVLQRNRERIADRAAEETTSPIVIFLPGGMTPEQWIETYCRRLPDGRAEVDTEVLKKFGRDDSDD